MRAIMAAGLLLNGCGTMAGGQHLTGREWRAADINGAPIIESAVPTLRLEGSGRASGSTGCNSFFGTYKLQSEQRVEFQAISRTERGCEPSVMRQENDYLAILEMARGYSVYRDGSLSLIAADGRAIRYRAAPAGAP